MAEADRIFPRASSILLEVPYFMDHDLYDRRGRLFAMPVRVALFRNGRRVLEVETPFENLQIF